MSKGAHIPSDRGGSLNAVPALIHALEDIGASERLVLEHDRRGVPLVGVGTAVLAPGSEPALAGLLRDCVLTLERHTSERDHRPNWPVQNFKILSYCLIACPSLSEVLARTAEFFQVLGPQQTRIMITISGAEASFHMDTFRTDQGRSAFMTDLVGLSNYQALFSWLIGEHLPVTAAGMVYPESLQRDDIVGMASFDVALGQPTNHFSFPSSYLSKRVIRTYPDLMSLLDLFPWNLLFPQVRKEMLSRKVTALMQSAFRNGDPRIDLKGLASFFGCSVPTLRRHLAQEGTSLNTLRNSCRREIATDFLRNTSMTVEEVAFRTGFSSATVLRRAFKQWTGQSPSDFRHGR